MSDPLPAGTPAQDDLQFDQAEYTSPTAPAETTCGACKRPIADPYYALNNLVLCPECRDRVEASWRGGSRIGRFAKAALLGSLAAVGGFALYFGVMKTTGYEIGLISILVGLLVGGAVRKGSGGRGGWAYQLLAIFLTYTAIVASYTGVLIPAMIENLQEKQAAKGGAPAAAKADPKAAEAKPDPAKEPVAAAGAAEVEEEEAAAANMPLPLALLFFVGLLYAIPIIAGFQSPMGLFIIGFALWEAWKMNRRARLEITGPYAVGGLEVEPGPAHA